MLNCNSDHIIQLLKTLRVLQGPARSNPPFPSTFCLHLSLSSLYFCSASGTSVCCPFCLEPTLSPVTCSAFSLALLRSLLGYHLRANSLSHPPQRFLTPYPALFFFMAPITVYIPCIHSLSSSFYMKAMSFSLWHPQHPEQSVLDI